MSDDTWREIENIHIGDEVMSMNMETKELRKNVVGGLLPETHCNIWWITLSNGKVLKTTEDHPILLKSHEWACIDPEVENERHGQEDWHDFECKKLEVGDEVMYHEKDKVRVLEIHNTNKTERVYNLLDVSMSSQDKGMEHKAYADHNFIIEGLFCHNKQRFNPGGGIPP